MRISRGSEPVERWGVYEVILKDANPSGGNPFTDTIVKARFSHGQRVIEVKGFYDGDGTYRIRFMPDETGAWSYETLSNHPHLAGQLGEFSCIAPSNDNHGPVHPSRTFHFSYADSTPFFTMGTTAYAWTYRPEEIRRKTLESFSKYGFNKIRMCVFPKHYGDGKKIDISYEPPCYPFEGGPNAWDFTQFDPRYFRNFEERVADLLDRGIMADVILFHPYDSGQWGIDTGMGPEDDLRYLDYLVARISAFCNVWWSLANEYDLMSEKHKSRSKDWGRIGRFLRDNDPYQHPRSVHNLPFGPVFPDADWLTHVSYQHSNAYSLLLDLRRRYAKPVINDEYQYEGNVGTDWGGCTAELETERHWMTAMAGGYGTHGEAFIVDGNGKDIFWSYGGELRGGSPKRLAFLKQVLESVPYQEMEPDTHKGDGRDFFCLAKGSETYLYLMTPTWKDHDMLFVGPASWPDWSYDATIYDAWNCTVARQLVMPCGIHKGLDLPLMVAIRLVRKRSSVGSGGSPAALSESGRPLHDHRPIRDAHPLRFSRNQLSEG
jgi:hypothetical protein